jgi:hypothetical protein
LKIKIYKTITLTVVLYVCEAWPLILREERRLRVFENKTLKRIFVTKRDEDRGVQEGSIMRNLIVCTVRLIESG